MRNEMPQLPYPNNGLEPVISAETIDFHYGKHLQTYVTNLANLTKGTEYEQKDIEDIVATAPAGGIFNNAGQVLNHTLYFLQFAAPGQSKPGRIEKADGRGRYQPVRLRLGMALAGQKREIANHQGKQCRQPTTARRQAPALHRRMGACLLHRLPQPQGRPCEEIVGHH